MRGPPLNALAPSPEPSGAHPVEELLASAAGERGPAEGEPPAVAVQEPPAPESAPESSPPTPDAPPLEVSSPAPGAPAAPPPDPPAPPPAAHDPEDLGGLWAAAVELVGAENKLLSAVLKDARPVALSEGELTVAFASTASFLKKKAEDSAHRAAVSEALRQLTGDRRLRVAYELREELPPPAQGEAPGTPRTEEEWVACFKEELDAEELVGAGEAINESE